MTKSEKPTEQAPSTKGPVTTPAIGLGPFEEMDRMFEEFLSERWPRAWMRPFRWEHPALGRARSAFARVPRVDVIDGDTAITVRAEMPGVKKENLEVSVDEESVTLRGRSGHEERSDADNYFRAEITHGEFVRTVGLPGAVNADKAKAKLEDGILELTLPKVEKSKRHAIKVE